MTQTRITDTDRVDAHMAKTSYTRAARMKLTETKARLDGVRAKIENAITSGIVARDARLDRARQAVEDNLAAAEARLIEILKSGDDWEGLQRDMDTAWENLSQSVKNLVAQFDDRST